MKCTNCGYEGNKPHQKKCALCGEPLEEECSSVEQCIPVNDQPTVPTEASADHNYETKQPCPGCGALLPEDIKFCPECGHNLNNAKPDEVSTTASVADNSGQNSRQARFWGNKTANNNPSDEMTSSGSQVQREIVPEPAPQSEEEPLHYEEPIRSFSEEDEEQINKVYDYDEEEKSASDIEEPVPDIEPTSKPSQGTSWLLPLLAAILSLVAGAMLYMLTK